MTDTNQKLREACNYIDALGGDSRSYRQSLALPTAGKMINGLTQAETDASASVSGLTPAPVGERDRFEKWATNDGAWPNNIVRSSCNPGNYANHAIQQLWLAWQARAALSAGDAVDAQRTPLTVLQYNAIPELCAIPPSLYESVVRAIERAHGIDAAMRKGQL